MHGKDIWTCVFVPVVTLFFQTIHAFVNVQMESRRVVHCGVTAHPTDAWAAKQQREATPFVQIPKVLICDNDSKFGAEFERVAKPSGIELIHRPYQAPRANAICERLVGSLRLECLDHVLVLGLRQLVRILTDYIRYFNQVRPHQGIEQRIPEATQSPPGKPKTGKVIAFPVLNGLHHDDRWDA
jgi:putative transposase